MLKCIEELRRINKAPEMTGIDFSGREYKQKYERARKLAYSKPGFDELSPAEKILAIQDECILQGMKLREL